MPIVYRCSNCGYVLHIFVKVGQNSYGVPTPSELANQYGGYCPLCGKPLNIKPTIDDIIIVKDGRRALEELLEEARKTMKISFSSIRRLLADERIPSTSSDAEVTA
ncbi:MAG: hypothetical protein ABWW69_04975 [Pyrodictiaceae archaeon]